MTHLHVISGSEASSTQPVVRKIGMSDLKDALAKGLDDFRAFPTHVMFLDGIIALGVLLLIIFVLWVAVAQAIYIANFGYPPAALVFDFVRQVFATPAGWTLIVVGNGVGLLFAAAVLAISVVSFPLLLDRDVGAVVAILTSVRAVLKNPLIIATWGLIVAALLVIGSLPLFVGLAVVMPVLGHSSWHLYRKLVEPGPQPRPEELRRPPHRRRYAVQLLATLFAGEDRR